MKSSKPDYSTAAGQTRMFYEVHDQLAQSNTQRMAALEIDRLRHALADTRNHPAAYPILAKHGFMERTPDGFKAIDPEQVMSRCRELIARLEAI